MVLTQAFPKAQEHLVIQVINQCDSKKYLTDSRDKFVFVTALKEDIYKLAYLVAAASLAELCEVTGKVTL
jgi:phenylalanyl-tRNA synthetase beta subunit